MLALLAFFLFLPGRCFILGTRFVDFGDELIKNTEELLGLTESVICKLVERSLEVLGGKRKRILVRPENESKSKLTRDPVEVSQTMTSHHSVCANQVVSASKQGKRDLAQILVKTLDSLEAFLGNR
jgi:hypothetical protein